MSAHHGSLVRPSCPYLWVHISPLLVLVGVAGGALVLFSLLRTASMDPGFIPRAEPPLGWGALTREQEALMGVFVCVCVCLLVFVSVRVFSPTFMGRKKNTYHADEEQRLNTPSCGTSDILLWLILYDYYCLI